jgi:hypothetical protein
VALKAGAAAWLGNGSVSEATGSRFVVDSDRSASGGGVRLAVALGVKINAK